jgi:DNA repair exonuclease SbcCD ATPase subunit
MIRTTALSLMVALPLAGAEAAGPFPAPHAVEAAGAATLVQMSPQERRRILRERLRDERAENRELREALGLAQEEILEQDAIIAALQREVRQLRGQNRPPRVARLEERVDRLQERLARRTAQVERLQERLAALRERDERRAGRLEPQTERRQSLRETVEAQQERVARLRDRRDELVATVQEQRETIARLRERAPGPRVDELRDRLSQSEEALAVARTELQRSEQQVENLRDVTQNLRQQIRGQEARGDDLERRLNARVAQVRRLESELAELRERLR